MCGRFTLSKPVQAVAELFQLAQPPSELAPRYNIAPSQKLGVVGLSDFLLLPRCRKEFPRQWFLRVGQRRLGLRP